MSGHSRWAQVKHKKAIVDAKKGQLFSKIVREITVAAREGGKNSDSSPRLRSALERARAAGLPKENVERAIERSSGGGEGAALQEFLYEAAWRNSMILIDGITDNRNRTLNEIKQIVAKHGAKMVPANSFLWNFTREWAEEGKVYLPKARVELSAGDLEKLALLRQELAEQADVQGVYTNLGGSL